MTDVLAYSRNELDEYKRLEETYAIRFHRAEQSMRGYRDSEGNWRGGLYSFIQYFWDVLEPETPLVVGWPLEAMCEHLECVTYGEVNRLLINVPPGMMKSLLTDVFWPAYEWGPCDLAHLRYVAFSYSSSLTERDNDKFGTLIGSDKYQQLWGNRVTLTARGKVKVANTAQGWKLASSIGGVGTGERGDRILLDDPHNIKESESETVRKEAIRWFRESMSNRLNDMINGAIVIIMQRVHEEDVSGAILELGLDYCHLRIPMEYEASYQFDDDGDVKTNEIGWIDPRFDPDDLDGCEGTLAWPERFPPEVVQSLKHTLGPVGFAGQYQQAPAPRGGNIFQRDWWQLWESPDNKFPPFEYLIASLDSAFTEKEQNDPSGFTVWGIFLDKELRRRVMLVHAWRKHLPFSGPRIEMRPNESKQAYRLRCQPTWGLIEWVADTCSRFKVDKLLIEAKASGISAGQELRNRYGLQDWSVQLCPVKGDKVARALAVQATFSQCVVYAPARDWAQDVIDEMANFPVGRYDDLTDSVTQSMKYLRDTGMLRTDEEARHEEMQGVMHRPKPRSIYPC